MIEPMISLAFAVHSNRGAYALLLGSGVSRAAGIPSGWEVVLDLIERVAALRGSDTGGDAAGWYRAEYGIEPDYAVLLEEIAASPAERSQLLRAYFEPTEDERAQNLKQPTAAHHAIARLAARGTVRLIITTNFDRLLEVALENEGVVPTVVATADAVEGALPAAHTRCTIIKLHGDYLDARIKNTPEELADYDERVDRLLDRTLDEYGLIIAGWSADWDTALRDAISRNVSRRFTTFWAARGELGEHARMLAEQRRAVIISITSADSFFTDLDEKVAALEDLDAPHPLSAKVAVATAKRYLVEERYRVRLFDLVHDEAARVERETSVDAFAPSGHTPNSSEMRRRLDRYEAICGPLVSVMAVGGYWGAAEHRPLWVAVLERLANRFNDYGGLETWLNLRLYPVVLALYAGGIGAVAADDLATLEALLSGATIRQLGREERPLILECAIPHVVDERLIQPSGQQKFLTPGSDRVARVLREPLREFLPHEQQYEDAFDRFEYLFALAFADYRERDGRVWAPLGSFGWRQRRRGDAAIWNKVEAEVETAGARWGLLQGRLFGGDVDRFRGIQRAFHEQVIATSHW